MVSARGEAAAAGAGVRSQVRGRRYFLFSASGGSGGSTRGASEAVRGVRADAPPRQDPSAGVWAGRVGEVGGEGRAEAGDLRLSRVYSSVSAESAGAIYAPPAAHRETTSPQPPPG